VFGFDIAVDGVLDIFCDWIYGKLIGFFGEFFTNMNLMGAELFELDWVQAILLFFSYFAWALYAVGLVVAVFDMAIEAQKGKGNVQDVALNALKGFFEVSLFTVVPVNLYAFCVSISGNLVSAITSLTDSPGELGMVAKLAFGSLQHLGDNVINAIVFTILIGYAVIKVFFANLKRGGILLIMMATGSLYMFSVPRGYQDGFVNWCKQVVALCLSAFLQTIVLVAGLVTFNTNFLLGIGLMLSATEVPRIAGAFGMDTSTRFNAMSVVHSANYAMSFARSISRAGVK